MFVKFISCVQLCVKDIKEIIHQFLVRITLWFLFIAGIDVNDNYIIMKQITTLFRFVWNIFEKCSNVPEYRRRVYNVLFIWNFIR